MDASSTNAQLMSAFSAALQALQAKQQSPSADSPAPTLPVDSIAYLVTYVWEQASIATRFDAETRAQILSMVIKIVAAYNTTQPAKADDKPTPVVQASVPEVFTYSATRLSSSRVVYSNAGLYQTSVVTEIINRNGSISYLFERRDKSIVLASRLEEASRALTKQEAKDRLDKWMLGEL